MSASLEAAGRSVGQMVHNSVRGGWGAVYGVPGGGTEVGVEKEVELKVATSVFSRHLEKNTGCLTGEGDSNQISMQLKLW